MVEEEEREQESGKAGSGNVGREAGKRDGSAIGSMG